MTHLAALYFDALAFQRMRKLLFGGVFSSFIAIFLVAIAGCAATPAPHGEVKSAPTESSELLQSDVNRLATLGMRDNLASLYSLMDKLYRRNPAEWKKSNASSREAAMQQVRHAIEQNITWPALQGKRDTAAMSLALSPTFTGDRVAAFIWATADMIITAHGGKTEFYLLDGLDAQHVYNAARNIEIGAWILSSRRQTNGQLLLLADEITERERNLSFEREFGKIVGRLDLLAALVTEKYRRAVVSYVQNLVGGMFLQFLPVR